MVQTVQPVPKNQGFTLVETLIAMSLAVVVLGAGFALTSSGLRNGNTIAVQQQVLEDLRTSGNYIADITSGAFYIFPPGAKITLGTAADYTVQNPSTGTNVWTVGTDPIIVALLLPRDSTKPCDLTSTEGCLRVEAFYPVKRATVTSKADPSENPGKDTANDNTTWTVFAYSENLNATNAQQYLQNLEDTKTLDNLSFTASKGYLLADYLNSGKFEVDYLSCLRDQNIQNTCDKVHTVSRLKFSMTSQVKTHDGTINIPKEQLSFQTAGRNLVVR